MKNFDLCKAFKAEPSPEGFQQEGFTFVQGCLTL